MIIAGVLLIGSSITALALHFSKTPAGVYCKDCGTEDNCNIGNGFDTGYQDCYIEYKNGRPYCYVDPKTWGDCEPYPQPE